MMSLPEKERGKLFGFSEDRAQPFRPLDRNQFSEDALLLLDRYRVDDANDPMALFVSIVDKMSAHQREVISRFEAAIALAGVEFGRIDLAIGKAEETAEACRGPGDRTRPDAEGFRRYHEQDPATKQF